MRHTPPERVYLSEFALCSLGIILFRYREHDAFLQIVEDLLTTNRIQLIRLGEAEMQSIVHAAQRFNLDFDDAYQYVTAERYNLTIVSFDGDFDRTERGRRS